jgi:hypothetical protein
MVHERHEKHETGMAQEDGALVMVTKSWLGLKVDGWLGVLRGCFGEELSPKDAKTERFKKAVAFWRWPWRFAFRQKAPEGGRVLRAAPPEGGGFWLRFVALASVIPHS